MKQGEIWYADLNPAKGGEQQGARPVVIVSGDMMNTYLPVVITCPLTTKIKEYRGNVILEPDKKNGLAERSEVMVFHIRSISKTRLFKKAGNITTGQLKEIKQGLGDLLRY